MNFGFDMTSRSLKTRSVLPGNGVYHSSPQKRFYTPIVFVHFFGGTQRHMRRHVQMALKLGFDAITFDLNLNKKWLLPRWPVSRMGDWGLKHLWADEIEDVLKAVRGPKILFSLSNPSSAAVEAMVRDSNLHDVKAWICDGGPFVDLWKCNWNYFSKERIVTKKTWRLIGTSLSVAVWSKNHERTLHEAIAKLPKNFPVLSLRAENDELVPMKAIEKAFAIHPQLNLKSVVLLGCAHLAGVKDAPEYANLILDFINSQKLALPE